MLDIANLLVSVSGIFVSAPRSMQQENGCGFGSVLQPLSLPESIVGSGNMHEWARAFLRAGLMMFVIGQYLQHDRSSLISLQPQ